MQQARMSEADGIRQRNDAEAQPVESPFASRGARAGRKPLEALHTFRLPKHRLPRLAPSLALRKQKKPSPHL